MHDVLRRAYGYDSTLLLNPNRTQLVEALDRLRAELTPDDNLLIFYAGHGFLDRPTGEGFWLSAEARPDSQVEWLPVSDVTRLLKASLLIARELGMDDERAEALRFAGILHDVGKLGVPTRLLRKDGPLTPEERRIVELHPEYGHEMVRGISFLGEARAAVLHHHERLDGSGYPYGLVGGQIPEFARIVAVADAFDAMTSTRSYRRARPVAAALAELRRCAGSQFDPAMVTALTHALTRHGWTPTVTATPSGNVPPGGAPAATKPAGDWRAGARGGEGRVS